MRCQYKMMKQFAWLAILLTAILFTSCNEKLDLQKDGRITMEEIFKDRNNTRGYLNSCYNYGANPSLWRSVRSDEAEDSDVSAGGVIITWYEGAITPKNYGAYSVDGDPWANLYEGIYKCNTFLQNIPNYSGIAMGDEVEGWKAQAHTLRALYYLMLIKRYGDVPLFDEPDNVGHDFSQDSKALFSHVVKFIIDDCRAALSAPESAFSWNIVDNQFNMMHRAVPYAIMSQAVTYAASPLWEDGTFTWEYATNINKEALSEMLTHDYKLFNVAADPSIAQNSYALYFLTEADDMRAVDKETILQRSYRLSVWRESGLPSTAGMAKAGVCPSQELVDCYEMAATGEIPVLGYNDASHLSPIVNPASGYDPNNPYEGRDPRFYASIYYNGAVRHLDQPDGKKIETFEGGEEELSLTNTRYTRTGYYLRKFHNYKSRQNNELDGAIRLFRLAEIYLNFAESAYQAYGPDEVIPLGNGLGMSAREAVNAIRRRAGMPDLPSGLSKQEFEKRYRNERRVELAFEDHRFFDVRRWKILESTDRVVSGMKIKKDGGAYTYERFAFSPRKCNTSKFLKYPINQDEIDKIFGYTGNNWQNEDW